MHHSILLFIKFNNCDTQHLNGPGIYFNYSAAIHVFNPSMYMTPTLIRINTVYVKAPLQVMYKKYSTRDGVKWQTQHKMKPSAAFVQNFILSTVITTLKSLNNILVTSLYVTRFAETQHNGAY